MEHVANFVFNTKSIKTCSVLNDSQKQKLEKALKRKTAKTAKALPPPPDFKKFAESVYNDIQSSYAKTTGSENSTGGGCQPLDIKGVENIARSLIKNYDQYKDKEEKISILWVCIFNIHLLYILLFIYYSL
jgi:hypothetical protein